LQVNEKFLIGTQLETNLSECVLPPFNPASDKIIKRCYWDKSNDLVWRNNLWTNLIVRSL